MAYFDNAATTYPKPESVYSFMDEYYRNNGGSAGRGNYGIALSSKRLIDDTRRQIQTLLHCPTKQVIFEPTATIALNIIIQGLIKKGLKTIYISPFEHNAVTRVLHHYEASGDIVVKQLFVDTDLRYDLEKIRYQFDDVRPELVIVSHASNVIGLVAPIEDIFSLAKEYGAITLADMSQTAGLIDCNVGLNLFDFAVFAGHKTLYGPTGISGFVMNPAIILPPVIFGGTGYDSSNQDMPENLPEKYEMGTMNVLGIAGLNAALAWLETITIQEINNKEMLNRERLLDILNQFDFIKTVGLIEKNQYVGIVSCVFEGITSDSMESVFNEHGIAVRTGLHCAPFAHKFLGTFPSGTVRFSVNYFTKEADFTQLKETLDYIASEI